MTDSSPNRPFAAIADADALARPRARHDGWSPERQVSFLEALVRTGNVKAAAHYVGLSRESAYKLRRRPDGRAFARAWDAALIHARDIYCDELMDRGLNGWMEPVWHQGEQVGERQRWSPPLFLAALKRLDAKADDIGLAGKPARVAAERFDDLLAGIGQGEDCAALLEEIDGTGEAAAEHHAQRSEADLIAALERAAALRQVMEMAPEDIDVSDLDVAQQESWDDLQWERAARSGLLERSGIWDDPEADEPGLADACVGSCDGAGEGGDREAGKGV